VIVRVRMSEGPCSPGGSAAEPSDLDISRALGEELRRTREALGWSRMQLVERLPSGIGDRTLLSYEHGTRNLTALRFIEISRVLGADPSTLMARGLQRARIYVENIALAVDLRFMLNDRSDRFRPMHQWARNTLNEHPDGVVAVEPAVVRHLALFAGCAQGDLANYLARFIPDDETD
jgi:transcriptional regulator with XRE-family HTH domain